MVQTSESKWIEILGVVCDNTFGVVVHHCPEGKNYARKTRTWE